MVDKVGAVQQTNANAVVNNTQQKSEQKNFIENVKDGDKKSIAILTAAGVALAAAAGIGVFAMLSSRPHKIVEKATKEGAELYDCAIKKLQEFQGLFTDKNTFSSVVNKSQSEGLENGQFLFGPNKEYIKFIPGENGISKGLFEIYQSDGSKIAEFEEDSTVLKLLGIKGNADLKATLSKKLENIEEDDKFTDLIEAITVKEDGIGTNVRYQYDFSKEGRLQKVLKATVGDELSGENVTAQLEILFDKNGEAKYIIKGVDNINDTEVLQGEKVWEKKGDEWQIQENKMVNVNAFEKEQAEAGSNVSGSNGTGESDQISPEEQRRKITETEDTSGNNGSTGGETVSSSKDPKPASSGEAAPSGENPKLDARGEEPHTDGGSVERQEAPTVEDQVPPAGEILSGKGEHIEPEGSLQRTDKPIEKPVSQGTQPPKKPESAKPVDDTPPSSRGKKKGNKASSGTSDKKHKKSNIFESIIGRFK